MYTSPSPCRVWLCCPQKNGSFTYTTNTCHWSADCLRTKGSSLLHWSDSLTTSYFTSILNRLQRRIWSITQYPSLRIDGKRSRDKVDIFVRIFFKTKGETAYEESNIITLSFVQRLFRIWSEVQQTCECFIRWICTEALQTPT